MNDLLDIRVPAVRQSLFEQILTELSVHADAEERTFYKAVIRERLYVLTDAPLASDFWLEKFGELKHAIEHHVREEEDEMFQLAQSLLNRETARTLAKDMDALKTVLVLEPAERFVISRRFPAAAGPAGR